MIGAALTALIDTLAAHAWVGLTVAAGILAIAILSWIFGENTSAGGDA